MAKVEFSPLEADERGLCAVGGDLEPETLRAAYLAGVFPWFDDSLPICWWSPDPRAIIEIDGLHVSRRLARAIRSHRFRVTVNQDFAGVMQGCADRPEEGTWITEEMFAAYVRLHKLGDAHSIEVWERDSLVGGLYGVAFGGFFAGESMFHRVSDASKIALAALVDRLLERRFSLFDVQFVTPHTVRMGAIEIPREQYLDRLAAALGISTSFV